MDILCFGEILFDQINGKSFLGGAPLNFAAHIAKLGARSFILSRVGTDEQGDEAVSTLKQWGVESKFVQRDENHATGLVHVSLSDGIPEYDFADNAAYDFIDTEEFILNYTVANFDLLYFGTLAQRNDVSRSTLWQLIEDIEFPKIFFDINLRENFYTAEIIHVSLHKATIFKLNDEEVDVIAELLYGREMSLHEFCENVTADFSLELVIVTKGGEGCAVYENAELIDIKGVETEVTDTVGAGDAFSAAFMYYYLKGLPAQMAAEKANRLGAFVASSSGAVPEYTEEIKTALQ